MAKPVVLFEIGSSVCRAGFTDKDEPSTVFPTVVGSNRIKFIASKQSDQEQLVFYIGKEAISRFPAEGGYIKRPVDSGTIFNWDDMEKIWHHTFYNELHISPEDHPILLTEPPLNARANREMKTKIMFETFHFPAFYLVPKVVLSLYAIGNITGTVCYSGNSVSFGVPIYEGHIMSNAVRHEFLGGRDLTDNLMKVLLERGQCTGTVADRDIVCDMKEKLCYVALDYEQEMKTTSSSLEKSYKFPDGRVVTIGTDRFKYTEGLFRPDILDMEHSSSLHELTYHSIEKCDVDIHKNLYANIVLCGGTTMFSGFRDRFQKEIMALVPPTTEVNVVSHPQLHNAVWIGGCNLASLSTFNEMCISKDEYDEYGPAIVHKKCF